MLFGKTDLKSSIELLNPKTLKTHSLNREKKTNFRIKSETGKWSIVEQFQG